MPAGAGADQDEAIDTGLDRLLGMAQRNHVVEDEATIGMRGLDDFAGGLEAGQQERHTVAHTGFEIAGQPVIGTVRDEIDRIGRIRAGQAVFDPGEPIVEGLLRPGVERGERTDNAGAAFGNHEIDAGDDEHRRRDDGQAQGAEGGGKRHCGSFPVVGGTVPGAMGFVNHGLGGMAAGVHPRRNGERCDVG